MEEVDITVIGAGVVGLAVAAEVSQKREVYVIERHHTFGQETSSRNSEVIHAGIYYPQGTLKAKTCVEGNALMYELCEKNNIYYKKMGKLIVATNEIENKELEVLLKRGELNGVQGLKLIDRTEIKKLEPNVEAIRALYSSNTGVVDSHSLMQYFVRIAKCRGAEIIYGANVVGIEKISGKYKVRIIDSDGEHFSFTTRVLINCAGLESDKISELVGIGSYKLKYCKGDYFSVGNNKSSLITHLIYPVPKGTNLGIHATLDVQGRLRLGPDDYYISKEKLDYSVDESKKVLFYRSVKRFLPFIELEDLNPDMSGIRPKLQGPDEGFRDFVIRDEEENGFPGFINLVGIESPGLTSSPSIAKYVNELIKD